MDALRRWRKGRSGERKEGREARKGRKGNMMREKEYLKGRINSSKGKDE